MISRITCNKHWQWIAIFTLICLFTLPIRAAVPDNIDYQGYLADSGGSPVNGTVNVTFALYNVDTGGIALWSDVQSVDVTNGLFTVKLGGAGAPFPVGLFDDPLWLGINIESDGEMTPRIGMSSAGFAHKANDALTLEGQTAASLDQSAHVTDTNNPHSVTAAQVGAMSSAEFTLHTANASAHHIKTTSFTELTDTASDAQIPNDITINQASNADTLDGLDSTAFMSAGTDNWVNTTGDTMSGNLNVMASVGIGTTTPAFVLDVRDGVDNYLAYFRNDNNGSGHASGIYAQGDAFGTGNGDGVGGYFWGTGGSTSGSAFGSRHQARAYGTGTAYGVYSVAIYGTTSGREWAFFGEGDSYFSGDVGIGTVDPASKLSISGGMTVGSVYSGNTLSDGNLAMAGNLGIGTVSPQSRLAVSGGATVGSAYDATALGDGNLAVAGNVGINVNIPAYRLDIRDGVDNYLAHFYNDNNYTGSAYGIYVAGDAYQTGTGVGRGGYFAAAGGSTSGNAYGTEVRAYAYGSSNAYGIYSVANLGFTTGIEYAFYGNGDGYLSGTLTKGGGGFKIDHPLDPENKYLYHSFVESPDMKNVYDGVVILDSKGEAQVTMPDWFDALNKDFRYQLTCIGGFAPVFIAEKISNNRFRIAGGKPGMEVSWQVTGIRQDAFANANRIQVEQDKQGIEVSTYLHPEAHGQTMDRSLAKAQAVEMGHEIIEPR